ncbi:aldo/keto reductase [Mucilaginibacter sp. KACC 22773]|uniref:aldo/keto reductase n=1 Tax=Mucilaginibacter sp. KACC 22773 TaxID=3025671 RepID=UPI0023656EF3|nr:aldo/keto reductase [Mucilaginibacter sp. KACC 22773]WDF77093.1 aldo/keto reductase [Mucilaginibacter sp. KACC 22773]
MKHKLFGTQTGLPASRLILGAASFGERAGYGSAADEIPKILKAFADAGGNFIDVADRYQLGEAEEIVGKFIGSQRPNYIICTKYTRSNEVSPLSGNMGNHRKAMRQAVEASLKRLNTDYIDIYMPHFDDGMTPIEEISRGLEDLVKAGKVLYTGLANFPAWKVAAIAGMIPLAALQIEYNLMQRGADRELMTVAGHFGLGTMLYSPLAGGLPTGKYRKGMAGRLTHSSPGGYLEDAATKTIIDHLELIAENIGATPGQVAMAWTLTKNAFPIVGARTLAHLEDSFKALEISLSADHIGCLEKISNITMGYPYDLLQTVQKTF